MPTHYNGNTEELLALDSYIKLTRAADSVNARSECIQKYEKPDHQPVWCTGGFISPRSTMPE